MGRTSTARGRSRAPTSSTTAPRLLASTTSAYTFNEQERLTDQDKINKVPGCWLILEAQGEVLREAIQNLEGLCAYWGWELEDPDLIT